MGNENVDGGDSDGTDVTEEAKCQICRTDEGNFFALRNIRAGYAQIATMTPSRYHVMIPLFHYRLLMIIHDRVRYGRVGAIYLIRGLPWSIQHLQFGLTIPHLKVNFVNYLQHMVKENLSCNMTYENHMLRTCRRIRSLMMEIHLHPFSLDLCIPVWMAASLSLMAHFIKNSFVKTQPLMTVSI